MLNSKTNLLPQLITLPDLINNSMSHQRILKIREPFSIPLPPRFIRFRRIFRQEPQPLQLLLLLPVGRRKIHIFHYFLSSPVLESSYSQFTTRWPKLPSHVRRYDFDFAFCTRDYPADAVSVDGNASAEGEGCDGAGGECSLDDDLVRGGLGVGRVDYGAGGGDEADGR